MGLVHDTSALRLHLGCGAVHLEGYVNIDYPLDQHSVLTHAVADVFADISELAFPWSSVDEIRLHHVFEHFPRAESLGLVASWWSWLKPDGLLRVEVPDFDRTAWAVLSPLSSHKRKSVALRHIFGSQEASWAYHQEGWSAGRLQRLLMTFGYEIERIRRTSWKGTYSVGVLARKSRDEFTAGAFEMAARAWLDELKVDDSASEQRLLEVWMQQFRRQLSKTWAEG
jgi:predicted SAM-dependent methyltransferase